MSSSAAIILWGSLHFAMTCCWFSDFTTKDAVGSPFATGRALLACNELQGPGGCKFFGCDRSRRLLFFFFTTGRVLSTCLVASGAQPNLRSVTQVASLKLPQNCFLHQRWSFFAFPSLLGVVWLCFLSSFFLFSILLLCKAMAVASLFLTQPAMAAHLCSLDPACRA